VRFHNDNEGVVRGYLTARWLKRLRDANLSTAALFELLFARSYGMEVIKPSLSETVGWLALWDNDVASEVLRRNPALLLDSGDPASLPPGVRRDGLVGLIKELTKSDHGRPWHEWVWWNNDQLRRFSQPDLGPIIVALWAECRAHPQAAHLLLRLARLGRLKDCAALAADAAFDASTDPTIRIMAGSALLATADEDTKRRYAALVLTGRSTLPHNMLRDALLALFPTLIDVSGLLLILESRDTAEDNGGLGLASAGPLLVEKLGAAAALECLLRGLLTQLGGNLRDGAHPPPLNANKNTSLR
jgi:hypothetical protein